MEMKPIGCFNGEPYYGVEGMSMSSVPPPKLYQRRRFCPWWLFQAIGPNNRWLRWVVMRRI